MKANDLFDIIKYRRSVMPNQYTDKDITQEELTLIFESANWAPNHKRTEPWRFKVVQGAAKSRLAKFLVEKYRESTPVELHSERKIKGILEKCERSNKIVLICIKMSNLVPEWEEVAATAMAVQNMWLMCTALQIGSYWSSPASTSKINEFAKLENDEKCYGIYYMGKIEGELPPNDRTPVSSKIEYIQD